MSAHLFDLDAEHVALTNDDWYTPRWIFDAAGLRFDMDVAAPMDETMRTCPAATFLTPLDDGLATPWRGLIWCNPPYSSTSAWVAKWAHHTDALLLVPAIRECRWLGVVLNNCSAFTLLNVDFHRPDGRTAHGRWPLVLASRGPYADAIARVAGSDRYIDGGYLVNARAVSERAPDCLCGHDKAAHLDDRDDWTACACGCLCYQPPRPPTDTDTREGTR